MGHVRLGKPPASAKWRDVVAYMAETDIDVAELAQRISNASEQALRRAADDPGFIESCWLLLKIPEAARSEDFQSALAAICVEVPPLPSLADVAIGYDAAVDKVMHKAGANATDLGEMAKHAGVAALFETTHSRLPILWETTAEDVRTTLATLSWPDRFGDLAQRFFTNLTERNLRYYLDRGWRRDIGPHELALSIGDMTSLEKALHRHCEESTLIMRTFSKEMAGQERRRRWQGDHQDRCARLRAHRAAEGRQRTRREKRSVVSRFDFACGGVAAAGRGQAMVVPLSTHGPGANVNLRIDDISKPMVAKAMGEEPGTSKAFSALLVKRGFRRDRMTGGKREKTFRGLSVRFDPVASGVQID